MKRVICIKSTNYKLEVGKTYLQTNNRLDRRSDVFTQDLDGKYIGFFPKEHFMDLEEWREKQINQILDDEKGNLYIWY